MKVTGLPWLLYLPSRLCRMAAISNLRLSGAKASAPWLTVKLILLTTAPSPWFASVLSVPVTALITGLAPSPMATVRVEETLSPSESVRVKPAFSRLFAAP
ncbi:hypothetical protein D3C72_1676020 [compost metagenome]